MSSHVTDAIYEEMVSKLCESARKSFLFSFERDPMTILLVKDH